MSSPTITRPAPTEAETRTRRGLPTWFGPWEIALLGLLLVALVAASLGSPYFATGRNFAITVVGATGLALMVVPMAGLMIAGEIDLSVASVFGLAGVIFGLTIEHGAPWPAALAVGLLVGGTAGLVNGWLTETFALPSLVVTVGTLGLYRGIAYILLENRSISAIPVDFTTLAQGNLTRTYIPYSLVVFGIIAIVAATVLHRGSFGRKTFAVGSSARASRFSGIRVRRVKTALFTVSGLVAALAGMLYTGYVSSARATNGIGLELTVVAIVLIGGVSMYGGKGSFLGVMLSLALVTALGSWMNLGFVPSNVQNTVIGLLMIGAVVVPALILQFRSRPRAAT